MGLIKSELMRPYRIKERRMMFARNGKMNKKWEIQFNGRPIKWEKSKRDAIKFIYSEIKNNQRQASLS